MFVVNVTFAGALGPLTDGEAFPTVEGALEKANLWCAVDGVNRVEVTTLSDHAARTNATVEFLVGLGAALGHEVKVEAAA